ncbi:MAG: alanine racemase, partial [Pseudomonadota bacterium]
VAPVAACVEAVDSVELAEAIDRRAARRIDCLIEVNIGDETTKSGIAPSGIAALASHLATLGHLNLRGLMIIPPYDPDPEKSRPYFKELKKLNDSLPAPLAELSMGMSHDLEVAIEEDATIVRVGTAIFGERG